MTISADNPPRSPLLPDRHPQRDVFICDIVDAIPKGDISSMEHPIFTLSTKPDMVERHYERGDDWIKIFPSRLGLATVFDRDILIYCISHCMAAVNSGRQVHRTIRFKALDLLTATNRQTSGRGYKLLKEAFLRLQGTQIETNLKQGGKEHWKVFGLIESAEIVRETRDGRMLDVEITLSDWVFDAIENSHVLTLSRHYFLLRKPLERRLYEIARKHCGNQPIWRCNIDALRQKCGSGSTLREFRRLVNKIIHDDGQHDHLPDYDFILDDDVIVVKPKRKIDQITLPLPLSELRLDPDIYDQARCHAHGWDMQVLEQDWRSWVLSKGIDVKNPNSHFLSFCKKRGAYKS